MNIPFPSQEDEQNDLTSFMTYKPCIFSSADCQSRKAISIISIRNQYFFNDGVKETGIQLSHFNCGEPNDHNLTAGRKCKKCFKISIELFLFLWCLSHQNFLQFLYRHFLISFFSHSMTTEEGNAESKPNNCEVVPFYLQMGRLSVETFLRYWSIRKDTKHNFLTYMTVYKQE